MLTPSHRVLSMSRRSISSVTTAPLTADPMALASSLMDASKPAPTLKTLTQVPNVVYFAEGWIEDVAARIGVRPEGDPRPLTGRLSVRSSDDQLSPERIAVRAQPV